MDGKLVKENTKQYPMVEINLRKIRENTKVVINICEELKINVVGVTKVSNGSIEVAKAMVEGGVKIIADSRIKNLEKYKNISIEKMLIRIPMISEIEEMVKLTDISLNSEMKTIRAIAEEAKKLNKTHKIILMLEVGDLREGIFKEEEILKTVEDTLKLKGVELVGIGTNLTCFAGVKPSNKNLGRLIEIKNKINNRFGTNIEVVSGGNSSSLVLVQNGQIPKGINQLRIGSAIFLGLIDDDSPRIQNTHNDVFKLIAEIVEIKEKPSIPVGERGFNAFGNIPIFEDKGIIKRAICAIGNQDCDPQSLYPDDRKIKIIGSSSDHLILDITKCLDSYNVGSKISFTLGYVSILRVMTSNHVRKSYLEELRGYDI